MDVRDLEKQALDIVSKIDKMKIDKTDTGSTKTLNMKKFNKISKRLDDLQAVFTNFIENQEKLDDVEMEGIKNYMESLSSTLKGKFDLSTYTRFMSSIEKNYFNNINSKIDMMKMDITDKVDILDNLRNDVNVDRFKSLQKRNKKIKKQQIKGNEEKIVELETLAYDIELDNGDLQKYVGYEQTVGEINNNLTDLETLKAEHARLLANPTAPGAAKRISDTEQKMHNLYVDVRAKSRNVEGMPDEIKNITDTSDLRVLRTLLSTVDFSTKITEAKSRISAIANSREADIRTKTGVDISGINVEDLFDYLKNNINYISDKTDDLRDEVEDIKQVIRDIKIADGGKIKKKDYVIGDIYDTTNFNTINDALREINDSPDMKRKYLKKANKIYFKKVKEYENKSRKEKRKIRMDAVQGKSRRERFMAWLGYESGEVKNSIDQELMREAKIETLRASMYKIRKQANKNLKEIETRKNSAEKVNDLKEQLRQGITDQMKKGVDIKDINENDIYEDINIER